MNQTKEKSKLHMIIEYEFQWENFKWRIFARRIKSNHQGTILV